MSRSRTLIGPLSLVPVWMFLTLSLNGKAMAVDLALEPLFDLPLVVAATPVPGDDRLFLTTIDGQVRIWQDGSLREEPFLDIRHRIRGDGAGLWNIAFHPNFPATDFVFAHYAEIESGASIISRFRLDDSGERLDPASERMLLRMEKIEQTHYGGDLRFGPDGYLYISTGDSTGEGGPDARCVSQSLDSYEGKILRLDVDQNVDVPPYYGVPAGNPFPGREKSEIWAYGLRNPWRFSFDRQTGDFWVSDVGEDRREEINWQRSGSGGGSNYGWKVMEGSSCFGNLNGCGNVPACGDPELWLPAIEYEHGGGRCSVIGGFVYRGQRVPSLYGQYLYGDFCTGEIWAARASGQIWMPELLGVNLPVLSSFGETASGELLLIADGQVFQLVDRDVPAAGLVEFGRATWTAQEGEGTIAIEVVRAAGTAGEVRVTARTQDGTARSGEDFTAGAFELFWAAGESGAKSFSINLLDDAALEPRETLAIVLDTPTGGAALGSRAQAEIEILDDENCQANATTLCLNDGRFQVKARWRDYEDQTGSGQAREMTESGGYFWFFSPDNPELFVKVLTGCEFNNFYWVFAAGLTDVEVEFDIIDFRTGERRMWSNALGNLFMSVRDLEAFACP